MNSIIKACLSALFISVTLLTSCSTSNKITTPSNPDRKFTTDNNIPIHVRFTAEFINPQGMPQRPLSTNYFVEVLNDMSYVDIPYVGRVYGPRGIINDGSCFKEPYSDLVVKRNKKDNGTEMSFLAIHENVSYLIFMELFDGGSASLTLAPKDAQPCHYLGTWDESQLYDKEGKPLETKYY